MKFYPVIDAQTDCADLAGQYKEAREIGKIHLGKSFFFFKSGLRTYYISYSDVERYFRRVMMVPAKLCCGKGELPVENLVVCAQGREVAQIQLPGTNAARILMEELKAKMPDAESTCPAKKEEDGQTAAKATS